MKLRQEHFNHNDAALVSCYDELPLWSAPFGWRLLDMVEYKKGITVLDIGFGTGFPLLELAMRLGASAKVFGIDPWSCGIERAKVKAAQYGISNIEILEGHAEEILLADQTIDLIVSNNGLNNVGNLAKVVAECSRVARKSAQFIMTFNLDATMIEFYDLLKTSLAESGLAEHIAVVDEHIRSKRPAVADVEAIFERSGFQRKKIVHDEFRYKFADGAAVFDHYFIRLGFLGPWKNCVPRNRQEEIFSVVEKKIDAIALEKTGFTMSVPFAAIEFVRV